VLYQGEQTEITIVAGHTTQGGEIQLYGMPDLVITTGSPSVTPSSVSLGGTVTPSSWTVKN
jgi:hypothetical protein